MRQPFLLFVFFHILSFAGQAQKDSTTGKFFKSHDGTNIYYEVNGKGKPVVLIHGFMGSSESWKRAPVYNDLLQEGYKVITVDLRGNGRSDKPHILEAYQNDAEAKDIIGLMKMLQLKKYSVMGYSRGAIIASRVLVLNKKVSHTVIGGMGIAFTDTAWSRRKMFYQALMGEPVPELADVMENIKQNIKKNGLDQLALAYSQGGQPSTSAKEFSKIKSRVLVICGDKDEDNGKAGELAAIIPQANFVTVPGDHGSALRSKEFSSEVISFLKKE